MERIRNKQHSTVGTRMNDTPRTDERTLYTSELSAIPPKQSERNSKFAVVYAEFARALELENVRLRSELEAKMEDGYSPRLPNPHDD
jgi:hypothetical protein